MSNTVQAAQFKGASDLWSRIIRFFTALARKASLANLIDATDGRIIGFLLHHRLLRAAVMRFLGGMLDRFLENDPSNPRAVRAQRVSMGRALLSSITRLFSAAQGKQIISEALLQRVIPGLMKTSTAQGETCRKFRQLFGENPPGFLTISPTRNCNLACVGCYANAVVAPQDTLDFDVFERILAEKKELWGSWFTVISGGEPLMSRVSIFPTPRVR